MLNITEGKGFFMQFKNGWGISVQFGAGNYCQNYKARYEHNAALGKAGSANAECAVFDPSEEMIKPPQWDDSVKGWMSADEVAELISWVQKQ